LLKAASEIGGNGSILLEIKPCAGFAEPVFYLLFQEEAAQKLIKKGENGSKILDNQITDTGDGVKKNPGIFS